MRARINAIYQRPMPDRFYKHFRDDLGLTEDYKKIMDSMRNHFADSQFHHDNTGIPENRFENMLKLMTDRHITELIRLAIIGYDVEIKQKTEGN